VRADPVDRVGSSEGGQQGSGQGRLGGGMAVTIVSRAEWGARTPKSTPSKIALPTPRLWIHHTAGSERGKAGMRSIQNTHMDDPKFKFADIGYSFVVDNADGTIFEGRGAGIQGAHTEGDNRESHAICVMGNFNNVQPSATAIEAIVALAVHGREQGWWTPTCRGHKEAPKASTECPGTNLFAQLGDIRTRVGVGRGPAPAQVEEELDVTEAELRQIVREEIQNVLDGQARRVQGITSWERYLEVLLEAARKD
jgi:N-acetylmuramoyl-L-alanine amidase